MAEDVYVVMDSRDIGTNVLPDAKIKIFLTASVEERAKRRYEEYIGKGILAKLTEIEKDIQLRDEQDCNREFAPLRQAEDAIYVDTSNMSIVQVQDYLYDLAIKGGQ